MESTLKNYIQNKSKFLGKYIVVYTIYLKTETGVEGNFAHALVFDTEKQAHAFIEDFKNATDEDKALEWHSTYSSVVGRGFIKSIEGLFIVENSGFLELEIGTTKGYL